MKERHRCDQLREDLVLRIINSDISPIDIGGSRQETHAVDRTSAGRLD
jgi:hypothetical protein